MNSSLKATVLIIEEHPVTRWGLRHFLETRKDIRIVGEAGSAAEGLNLVRATDPDVVITDITLSDGDGLRLVRDITRDRPRKVLAFSATDSWDKVESFIRAGGTGFVTKRCPPDELIMAMDAVIHGRKWISPTVRKVTSEPTSTSHRSGHGLSPREREVVALVARGLTSRQIADQLCVSLKTVETHRYRIFRELQIKNRAQLVSYAIQNGLLGNVSA